MLYYIDYSDLREIGFNSERKPVHLVKTVNNEFIDVGNRKAEETYNLLVDYSYMVPVDKMCVKFSFTFYMNNMDKVIEDLLKIEPLVESGSIVIIDEQYDNILSLIVTSDDDLFIPKVISYLALNAMEINDKTGLLFNYKNVSEFDVSIGNLSYEDTYAIASNKSWNDIDDSDMRELAKNIISISENKEIKSVDIVDLLHTKKTKFSNLGLNNKSRELAKISSNTLKSYLSDKSWEELYLENNNGNLSRKKYVKDTLELNVWDNFEELYDEKEDSRYSCYF